MTKRSEARGQRVELPDGKVLVVVDKGSGSKNDFAVTRHHKEGAKSSAKLVQCEDCGKQISRRATTCPNCGAPISETKIVKEARGMLFLAGIILAVLIVGAIATGIQSHFEDKAREEREKGDAILEGIRRGY